ncbi:3'-5' exonuclease [Taklimakanibacter deserti]|uniref:3'-5' exonuclease n=1 Tax=Taklimakanibacter deserti TaxID=2267839 RepID=UPI000E658C06
MGALNQLRRAINRVALADRNYAFLFEPEPGDEVVSLDCETTGFDPWVDEIVSIAAIRVTHERIHASSAFRALVRPESAIRPASIKVHRLREQDVADARPMQDVLPALLHFIGSRPLVGYWVDFDVRMLDKYLLSMLNIRLPNRRIDVSRLYYDRKYGRAPPGTQIDLRYTSILTDLGLQHHPQHDAFEDALGAAEMYLLLDDMRQRGVTLSREPMRTQDQFALA